MNWDVKAIHESRDKRNKIIIETLMNPTHFSKVRSQVKYEHIPLPRYNCHKEVKAFKIEEVDYHLEEAKLIPESKELLPALVTMEWISKHGPILPGGYFIVYEDGYESYSPAAPFEEGYTLVEGA